MDVFAPDQLCDAVQGTWLRHATFRVIPDGVGIDSRGDLTNRVFFAIAGDRHDGHEYLHQAAAAGASVLVVERDDLDLPEEVGILRVQSTRQALGRLARAHRQTLINTTVIAITGSAGKTTTKSLVEGVLSSAMPGTCAEKSFNNDIGVPLTILAASQDDRYLILEIGTNAPGEIDALAAIAQPNIAVITMVGRSHLAGLGSVEAVAREKASLLKHLIPQRIEPGNTEDVALAILHADSPELRAYTTDTAITFGEAPHATLRLTGRGRDADHWWFEVNAARRFALNLPGKHNAVNALVAVAIGRTMGIDDAAISTALRTVQPGPMRFAPQPWRDALVYNDAYNANPDSMRAALETFAELTTDAPRRIIILGDMGELGDSAIALHQQLSAPLAAIHAQNPIAHCVLIGPLAQHIADGSASVAAHITLVPTLTEQTIAQIQQLIQPGDAVLLKASRSCALERILTANR